MAENTKKNIVLRALDSTKECIHILKNANRIAQYATETTKRNDPNWYFSDEGRAAYDAADTPAQKTKYFFDYLMAKKPKNVYEGYAKPVFFKLAVIMACAIDKSSLEYPKILDYKENVILKSILDANQEQFKILSDKDSSYFLALALLSGIHGKAEKSYISNKGYHSLCHDSDENEYSDLYKLERTIIGVCCSDSDILAPYDFYSLSFTSNEDEDDLDEDLGDINDDLEEDEE